MMPGYIKKFRELSGAEQKGEIHTLLSGPLQGIISRADFSDIVAGSDAGEWSIDGYEIIGKPRITHQTVTVKARYHGSRSSEAEWRTPFISNSVQGNATAVIDDDRKLDIEEVTGTLDALSAVERPIRSGSRAPIGSLEWEEYWVHRSWQRKRNYPNRVYWTTINGLAVAIGEDHFHPDGWRYGIETVAETPIRWNTAELYGSENEAKRAALMALALVLCPSLAVRRHHG